jgi:hypothetical protein
MDEVTKQEFEEIMKGIKNRKTGGKDEITNKQIKYAIEEL